MPALTLGVATIDVIMGPTPSAPRTVVIHDGTQFVAIGTLDPATHTFSPAVATQTLDGIKAQAEAIQASIQTLISALGDSGFNLALPGNFWNAF